MTTIAPGLRRGVPLWTYLTALVVVPLLGVGVLTLVEVRGRVADAAGAARAEAAVRAVAQLDTARGAIQREIVPVLSIAVLSDASLVGSLGLPAGLQQSLEQQSRATVVESRATADRSLAQLARGPVGAAAARRAATGLTALRSDADARRLPVDQVFEGYLAITDQLAAAQRAAATSATAERLTARTEGAVRDVQLVAQLAQAATEQLPVFLGTQFSVGGARLSAPDLWSRVQLAYSDDTRAMSELTDPATTARWAAASWSVIAR